MSCRCTIRLKKSLPLEVNKWLVVKCTWPSQSQLFLIFKPTDDFDPAFLWRPKSQASNICSGNQKLKRRLCGEGCLPLQISPGLSPSFISHATGRQQRTDFLRIDGHRQQDVLTQFNLKSQCGQNFKTGALYYSCTKSPNRCQRSLLALDKSREVTVGQPVDSFCSDFL